MTIIVALLCLFLALGIAVVRKSYFYLPLPELKRQAAGGDVLAKKLYEAAAYGSSLKAFLWVVELIVAAVGFVLLVRFLPAWISLVLVVGLLWLAFSWLPSTRLTAWGARTTALITPLIKKLVSGMYPVLSRVGDFFDRQYAVRAHTGLYERTDLLELIDRQRQQPDNRLSEEELGIVYRTLTFDELQVGSILSPRSEVKTVSADATLGPILIDELHKSGQDFVVVTEGKNGSAIGSLNIAALGLKTEGKVRDHMNDTVYYLHEHDSLTEALHAFFTTNYPLFIVINSFEEFIGIVSVEHIVRQLLGHIPGDEFELYTSPQAVAGRHPRKRPAQKAVEKPEKV